MNEPNPPSVDGPIDMPRPSPALTAAMDQATASARAAVAPLGGHVVDTRDALFTVVIERDGTAYMTGTTRDWQWVADALRRIADDCEQRAS